MTATQTDVIDETASAGCGSTRARVQPTFYTTLPSHTYLAASGQGRYGSSYTTALHLNWPPSWGFEHRHG
jgi:hypothetical protein